MPRWRKLHTKVTESFDVNDMPDDFTRLFWVLLQLAADREGRGIDIPGWIKGEIMPLREDVTDIMINDAMAWLAQPERNMVRRYKRDGHPYFLIVNFHEYQKTEREAPSYFPAPHELVTNNSEARQELGVSSSCLEENRRDTEEIQIREETEEPSSQSITGNLFRLLETAGVVLTQHTTGPYTDIFEGASPVLVCDAIEHAKDKGVVPNPGWLRTVVLRCKRQNCKPGEWPKRARRRDPTEMTAAEQATADAMTDAGIAGLEEG